VVETTNGAAVLNQELSGAEAWAEEFADLRSLPLPDDEQIEASGANYEQYIPTPNNPYLSHPSPLEEGSSLFRSGNLTEASLALEAAVQREPGNAFAWRTLGASHAENDEDKKAIACYKRALACDPNDAPSLMALGVSYTNELDQSHALNHLRAWLASNPKYSEIPDQAILDLGDNATLQQEVTHMFCEAARVAPTDPEVFTVLGVLYNLSREYDHAAECFNIAARLDPQNYSLWNKLGATLANSYRNEEAVGAYQEALRQKPSYLRAWANLGICFANQGMYDMAANNYIGALRLNPQADHLWINLTIALTCMGRNDLVRRAEQRDMTLLTEQL